MAAYHIPVLNPVKMKEDVSQNWKTFEESWKDYVIATELKEKSDAIQVATLLKRIMGEDCCKTKAVKHDSRTLDCFTLSHMHTNVFTTTKMPDQKSVFPIVRSL